MKNYISFLLLTFLPLFANAQPDFSLELESYFAAIIVQNMDTSLAWYSEKLGFEIVDQSAYPEMGFRQVNLKREGIALELIELKKTVFPDKILSEQPPKTKIGGFFKWGFRVSEFDKWVSHFEETGTEFNGQVVKDKNSGKRMVVIFDPDGNRIQLFED